MIAEAVLQAEPVTTEDKLLTSGQIHQLINEVFGWEVIIHDDIPRLRRSFVFENMADALRFTDLVGQLAKEQGYHPKITTEWGETTVEWWSQSLGGLHRNDFVLAAKTNDIYQHWDEITGKKEMLDQALEDTFPASDPVAFNSQIE